MRHRPLSEAAGRAIAHTAVLAYAAAVIVPFIFLFLSSVRSNQEIFSQPLGIPTEWRFENYSRAFGEANLGDSLLVSAFVTVLSVAITLALALPAAYAIARVGEGRIAGAVEAVFASGLLIPSFAVLVPTFFLAVQLKMLNQPLFVALFYPATGLPITVLLLVQFMRGIPRAVDEAAMIDGATRATILWRLIIPMSIPGIVTVTIFNVINFWNEYIFALVLLGGGSQITAQVALPRLQGERLVDYGLVAAGAVIVMLPVLLCYAVLQKQTQQALTAGAVKE
ncbi:carbohydrate ABC transporter permease [Actinotalea sp. K2]|uniref:carbohydrate ABC transporter permease n=1 Tax=Actinotalea sp. K2 TaxID=2939438 RepID=UPI00201707DD|nr:carbohydrate ABC transporter permease [Actinotalea sp. K2]MCL3863302.1 carbohydrate ABC transporter permease [Actinotalea sp. K2]